MKVTFIWEKPSRWWLWPFVPLFLAVCLLVILLYLPALLGEGLSIPYNWLRGRAMAALWARPFNQVNYWAWYVPASLLYRLLVALWWYRKWMSSVVSKVPFQSKPAHEEVNA